MSDRLGIIAAAVMAVATPALAQEATPIFHPGAPGAPSRIISADQAVELSRTTFIAADVAFMQHMIVHHNQAVEMVALLDQHGSDPTVKLMGRRIAMTQEAEMAFMKEWLRMRNQPLEMQGMDHSGHGGMDHSAHAGHAMPLSETPLMPGMLSPAAMQRLSMARGAEFDRLFLEGMIQHHLGALDMVSDLLATPDAAQDPMLSDFTSSVVADQSAEILRMQSLLSDL